MSAIRNQELFIKHVYDRLLTFFGPQGWWPGQTPFEVIIGAILTQNTAWSNVEKAIINLKKEDLLSSPERMLAADVRTLASLIRPAGYYNIKARRIRNFLKFLKARYGSRVAAMARQDAQVLRRELLEVNGIGPETCDSILLYACNKPVFVVDAYTRRIFSRHGVFDHDLGYEGIQKLFMSVMRPDRAAYNEYHALIVKLAKEYCRTQPKCEGCPLCGSARKALPR